MQPGISQTVGIPLEIWNEILSYLKPQDLESLRRVNHETKQELDDLRPGVDAEHWAKKLAKLKAQRLKIYDDATKLNKLAKIVAGLPHLDQRNAKDLEHLKNINSLLGEYMMACETGVKEARERVQRIVSRKALTNEQETDLKNYLTDLERAEATYLSQNKQVAKVLGEKTQH